MDLLLQLLATGLVVGSLYALCALGWGLIYGTTLHFHVAHGAVFSLAAYFAYVGQKLLHLPLGVAVVGAILAAAAAGLLIDLLLYQQLERRGALRTSLFIASLGLLILIENVLAIVFTPDPMRLDIGVLDTSLVIGPVFLTYLHVLTVVLAVAGYLALDAVSQALALGAGDPRGVELAGDGAHGGNRSQARAPAHLRNRLRAWPRRLGFWWRWTWARSRSAAPASCCSPRSP